MATADLIDPAITESDFSSVSASPAPHHTDDAAAAAAAVDALAASHYDDGAFKGDGSLVDATQHSREASRAVSVSEHAQSQSQPQHMQAQPQPQPPPSSIRGQPASVASPMASPAPAILPPAATVHHYNPAVHAHLTLYLAALHGSRITADNLSGTFAPPLHHEKLLDWWKVRLTTAAVFLLIRPPQETVNGSISGYGANYQAQPQAQLQPQTQTQTQTQPQIQIQTLSRPPSPGLGPSSSSSSSHYSTYPVPQQTKISGQDLVGVIMLQSHPSETSPHVATVELLLVNLQYRQLGGERQLMETVEQQAVLEGLTLLTAQTESDSSMANMFKDLGFTEAGRIPGMINRPLTGEKRPQSIFYKDLSPRL